MENQHMLLKGKSNIIKQYENERSLYYYIPLKVNTLINPFLKFLKNILK